MVDFNKLKGKPRDYQAAHAHLDRLKAAQKRRIDKLCAIGEGLTEWEVGFVEGVADRFERDGYLSDKQWTIIDGILEKHA